jgi:hypothetical protein
MQSKNKKMKTSKTFSLAVGGFLLGLLTVFTVVLLRG